MQRCRPVRPGGTRQLPPHRQCRNHLDHNQDQRRRGEPGLHRQQRREPECRDRCAVAGVDPEYAANTAATAIPRPATAASPQRGACWTGGVLGRRHWCLPDHHGRRWTRHGREFGTGERLLAPVTRQLPRMVAFVRQRRMPWAGRVRQWTHAERLVTGRSWRVMTDSGQEGRATAVAFGSDASVVPGAARWLIGSDSGNTGGIPRRRRRQRNHGPWLNVLSSCASNTTSTKFRRRSGTPFDEMRRTTCSCTAPGRPSPPRRDRRRRACRVHCLLRAVHRVGSRGDQPGPRAQVRPAPAVLSQGRLAHRRR